MNTTTQQIPSNPALDFANAVLAETDGGREIVLMLHDIAQGRPRKRHHQRPHQRFQYPHG